MRRLAYVLFAGTVALAPFPVGSLDAIWVGLWLFTLSMSMVLADLGALDRRHLAVASPMLIAAAGVAVALLAQSSVADRFVPPNPAFAHIAPLIDRPVRAAATATAEGGFPALGPLVLSLLAFLCGIVHGARRQSARLTLRIVALSGLGYIVFGIVSVLADPGVVLWKAKQIPSERLSGTFINPNTAATYFGAIAILWLAVACDEIGKRLPTHTEDLRAILELGFSRPPPALILAGLCFLLALGAVFMTGSRAGSMATFLGVLIVVALSFRRARSPRTIVALCMAGFLALLIALLELWGGGGAGLRLGERGFADVGRAEVYKATLAMIRDHPLLGIGLGTYAEVFPAYRTDGLTVAGINSRAHSTPLEVAAEMGIPVAAIVMLACFSLLVILLRGALVRQRDVDIPVAIFALAIIGFVHTSLDFSLQIPGFAVVFWSLLGVGAAGSLPTHGATNRSGRGKSRASRHSGNVPD